MDDFFCHFGTLPGLRGPLNGPCGAGSRGPLVKKEPSLSVQTFCVHTCIMVSGGLDNVHSLVFFFLWLPLATYVMLIM